jgi:hypothetical protein
MLVKYSCGFAEKVFLHFRQQKYIRTVLVTWNLLSNPGSRFFFSIPSNHFLLLFMRPTNIVPEAIIRDNLLPIKVMQGFQTGEPPIS